MIIVENSITKFNKIQKTRKNYKLCFSMIDSKLAQSFQLPTLSKYSR